MAKQQTDSPFNQDEFQRIFDEYRSKIEEITRSTGRNLESLRVPKIEPPAPDPDLDEENSQETEPGPEAAAQPEAEPQAEAAAEPEAEPEAEAETEAEATPELPLLRPVQPRIHIDLDALEDDEEDRDEGKDDEDEDEAEDEVKTPLVRLKPTPAPHNSVGPVIRDAMESHLPESQKAIREARRQAQRIIEDAEKQIRKEAKKKTKAQVDKILAKARTQAEAYAEKARKTVEQERTAVMETARAQVEDTLKTITEQARQQSQAKSAQILAEAQERADHLMREVTEASAEVSKQVKDVIDRARDTIGEFEERLHSETEGITKSIAETQSRIEAMAQAAAEEAAKNTRPPENNRQAPAGSPTMVVRVLGERSNGRNGTQPLFFGMVETIAPPETCDYRYFKSVKRYLVSIPGIKQLQESASEKELSALFDVTEPLPLLELLSKVPQVDEVISRSDRDIAVVFEKGS